MAEKGNIHQREELVDNELIEIGVKYTDRTKLPKKPEAEVQEECESAEEMQEIHAAGKIGKMMANISALVAADSLMIFMCMADKIELLYGLIFLAAASAFFGGKVRNAKV